MRNISGHGSDIRVPREEFDSRAIFRLERAKPQSGRDDDNIHVSEIRNACFFHR